MSDSERNRQPPVGIRISGVDVKVLKEQQHFFVQESGKFVPLGLGGERGQLAQRLRENTSIAVIIDFKAAVHVDHTKRWAEISARVVSPALARGGGQKLVALVRCRMGLGAPDKGTAQSKTRPIWDRAVLQICPQILEEFLLSRNCQGFHNCRRFHSFRSCFNWRSGGESFAGREADYRKQSHPGIRLRAARLPAVSYRGLVCP